jgi:hypothetical protein
MNRSTASNAGAAEKRREGAGIRGMVLGLAFFAAGIALSAFWFYRAPSPGAAAPQGGGPTGLSDATKGVLQHLGSPVEIRFYSLLDPGSVDESGREFSGRVDQLLAQYEQESGGKIKITKVNTISSAAANAAVADGIKPFNMDKGDACYLGLAVVRKAQKSVISSLAPEWESALESDLSRAIASLDQSDPFAQPAAKVDAASLAAVKRALPALDSVSVAEGSQTLRAASRAQFEKTGQEMQEKVAQAEQRFLQAQNSGSQAEQEAALKDLQQVKKEQMAKLQEIALASKAQQAALQQIKGAAH